MAKNNIATREAGEALGRALAKNSVLKELDISGDGRFNRIDGPGFAKGIADGVKNNGALTSLNISANSIGTEQEQNLVAILNEHSTLKSLCGNKGDEAELDMSGKNMGADGAIMLAPEIVANGALTSLNMSNNRIGYGGNMSGVKALAAAIPECR